MREREGGREREREREREGESEREREGEREREREREREIRLRVSEKEINRDIEKEREKEKLKGEERATYNAQKVLSTKQMYVSIAIGIHIFTSEISTYFGFKNLLFSASMWAHSERVFASRQQSCLSMSESHRNVPNLHRRRV